MKRHFYLIGMPGAGKSTVGKRLAEELEVPFRDLDDEIEKKAGCSISEIFQHQGENAFRQMERDCLVQISSCFTPQIVATGGGIVLHPQNREILQQSGFVVYLEASISTLCRRLENPTEKAKRPLVQKDFQERISTLLAQRANLYHQISDQTICTDHATIDEIVAQLKRYFFI